MTTPNRWAIREAGEASFYSLEGGSPIVTLRTLKTSGVETTGETVYARGGRGNAKLVGFSSNKEAKLTLEDAIFDNRAIAMLTGNNPTFGQRDIYRNEIITVTDGVATLSKTPSGKILSLYTVEPDGSNGEEYTIGDSSTSEKEFSVTGKDLAFHNSVADDTKFRVYYKVTTDNTATTIKVTSDMFGGTFKVVLDVLVRDEYTKKDFAGQLIVPCAKFEDNFSLNCSAEGDPAVLSLGMEVLKDPTSNDMWELVIFDEDLIN